MQPIDYLQLFFLTECFPLCSISTVFNRLLATFCFREIGNFATDFQHFFFFESMKFAKPEFKSKQNPSATRSANLSQITHERNQERNARKVQLSYINSTQERVSLSETCTLNEMVRKKSITSDREYMCVGGWGTDALRKE